MMTILDTLAPLRARQGQVRTPGLPDESLLALADNHPSLVEAAKSARSAFDALDGAFDDLLDLDEADQIERAQAGFVNFYADDAVNPYVALTAAGPWVITLKGRVIHDSGGYGMLGFGHAPAAILEVLAKPQAMANIMTPSLSHLRLEHALRAELGASRGGCPYAKFMALNSGSELVSLAGRIADVNAKLATDPGGTHAGQKIRRLAVRGGFHGRTELPGMYSDSTRKAYKKHLASYRDDDDSLLTIEPYDIAALRQAFADAKANGWFFEAMFLEPVMGEGDPGRAVPPEFYAEARRLTREHGTLLLVDSIQAGLRAHGVLSIVDYPGFEDAEAPDMESFSKALNAGQYPLSVLAVSKRAAALYRKGTYGNTMTANPRAMDVAVKVLELLTPDLRQNIRRRGQECLQKFQALAKELGGPITKIQGTGLLFSCELAPEYLCYGEGSTEEWLREQGIGVIHGGANSLRFTPWFELGSDEIDLVIGLVRRALVEGPRKEMPATAQAA